ncbi:PREDICTED: two-component response regulator ARR17-like [Erythranthe guttata]|uniref:two-component response regulator ARR17-like n=1 Tax=Erythranthe guttata TaxID=4155 RepID=UPI00064DA726|nr:PREDICTED: two-component response regulator ARR17-like [Erythranthe guttata]|eukprot:XP_012858372.1 PREDICTED: two-component response regulator ARR17-like [Erythranthe guttata]
MEVSSSSKKEMEQPHVVVIDDCRATRMIITLLFKKFSCKVTNAESGFEALEILGLSDDKQTSVNDNKIPKVDMISTDYNMPGMNGYELLKKIKQESSTMKDVPVVIVSSNNDPTLINK